MREVFDRVHCAMAASSVPPFFVAAAVLVHEAWTQPGINALVIAVAMFLSGPVIAGAISRAARVRRFGRVEATEAERRS